MKATAKIKKRSILQESSSEDKDQISVYFEEEPIYGDEKDDNETVDPYNFPIHSFAKDFIIVHFEVEGKRIYYAAEVIGEKGNDIEVSFLRNFDKIPNNFHMPDIAMVAMSNINMILSKPKLTLIFLTSIYVNFVFDLKLNHNVYFRVQRMSTYFISFKLYINYYYQRSKYFCS